MDRQGTKRRRLLVKTTLTFSAVGVAGGVYPLLSSMSPSARAQSAGGPVSVDVSKLLPGQQIVVVWRQKPVWVLRRSSKMIDVLGDSNPKLLDPESTNTDQQPEYAQNIYRSIEPDVLVVVALCTHLGCIPTFRPDVSAPDLGVDWRGGYFCPCHGSRFDLAGRVYKNVPAPANLAVPPHGYLSNSIIEIGNEKTA